MESVTIPFWFKYAHCVIWLFLLLLPLFIYQIFKNAFGSNTSAPSKYKDLLKFSVATKQFLSISVTLSYTYIMTTSTQSLLMWINTSPGDPLPSAASTWCPFFASYRMFSYCTGRILLYSYFIFRSNDIFRGTFLQFSNCNKYGLLSYLIFIVSSLVVPSALIYFGSQSWTTTHDENDSGTYCLSDDTNSKYIRYIFAWGSLNDMTFAVITIFMMISRLFLLLVSNERKKSEKGRYQFSSTSGKEHDFVFPIDVAPETETPDRKGVESVSSSPRTPRTPTQNDAMKFHSKTFGHNKLILLISKFFIILMSVVISSQVVLIVFVLFKDMVLILYSMDTMINIVCLWLTFGFSDNYYNTYCCGRCCTKCCFPFIKTVTLTCNQYDMDHNKGENKNKCCIYCRCCCFASCRYCCSDNNTPKEIYHLARLEIDLIISSNEEKSMTTMEQMSTNHSRKDVEVVSVEKSNISVVE